MLRFLAFLLLPLWLFAAEMHLPVKSVSDDTKEATVQIKQIALGVHGFVVRHFTRDHSVIIADIYVKAFDPQTQVATLALSEYTGLQQSSLPNGDWHVQVGDEVILAFGYSRALLLAPTEEIYHIITKNVHGVEWNHPDAFATSLSFRAHPTPFKEDISGYCTIAEVGLLYLYVDGALFTMDCQTFSIIQTTPVTLAQKEIKLPFYSRVEEISTSWWVWGEASRHLESYDEHYLKLLVKYNKRSKPLYNFVLSKGDKTKKLIKHFDIKE